MNYPTKAEVNGQVYDLNTSYKTALRCIKIVYDPDIGDSERALAVIKMLFGFIPEGALEPFLDKAILFLSCGKKDEDETESESDERYFDHNYDFGYVTASFASDYHIDLTKEGMHWWRYNELLNGLTKNSILQRVIEIRRYDTNEVKDPKDRATLLKAKESVALPIIETEEEREMREKFEQLLNVKG